MRLARVLALLLVLRLASSFSFKLDNEEEIFPASKKPEVTIQKSKVEVLGEILKKGVDALRKRPNKNVELVFLVDSSASVGAENFFNELKFVKKLLADFTVAFNETRVAVVTFSSKNKVVRHVDHLTNSSGDNHKCSLSVVQLPKITYSGGGTFTLGALLEAKRILLSARPKAAKAVFLITDGYSNGGDPRPVARDLRKSGVEMFTFGIRNGNVRELYDMASEPQQQHSFILDSFEEFEALARRALHEDLNIGTYQVQSPDACKDLCSKGGTCCDSKAQCTCGVHTGHYACVCRKGFYGTGHAGDCHPCPAGAYRDEEGPGNIDSCKPCPDMNHYSSQGSGSISECKCKLGYKNVDNKCEVIECQRLRPPPNGHFVRYACSNVFNAACGIRCDPGYRLEGSSIRLCGENGSWSGDNATCAIKSCPALKPLKNGSMNCSNAALHFETECNLTCNPGFVLVGSKTRYCLAIALWDGLPGHCRPIFCPPLPSLQHGKVSPGKCVSHKSQYGEVCNYTCEEGFAVNGPDNKVCVDPGAWSDGDVKTSCDDVAPPSINCPEDIEVSAEEGENGALLSWELPTVTDNSVNEVSLAATPAVVSPSKFKIGVAVVTYVAEDKRRNRAECNLTVTVKDTEAPTVDSCVSPPTFLLRDPTVEIIWEEPIFSDNSGGTVRVERSRDPGPFPYGETLVTYTAWDESGNNSTCNVHIIVQEHACTLPVDPIQGNANCSSDPSGVRCSLTCNEGYAFAIRPAANYFCAYDGLWIPSKKLPFPDCSVTLLPQGVVHNSLITLFSEDVPCEDQFFLSQVENRMQKKISGKLAEYCAENAICEVEDVTALCGFHLYGTDGNILTRRKRTVRSQIVATVNETLNAFDNVSLLFRVKGHMQLGRNYTDFVTEVTRSLNLLKLDGEKGELDLRMGHRHLVYNQITVLEENPLLLCEPGSVLRDEICVKCPVGTFYNVVTEECQSCSRGSYQFHEGQLSCLVCPGGTSTSEGQAKSRADCKAQCLPGSFSQSGLEFCETCARGSLQPDYARNNCTPCPDSTTTSRRGARKPEDCRKLCLPGLVSETGLSPCFNCPVGYYQKAAGQMSCLRCPKTGTTPFVGSTSISDCQGYNGSGVDADEDVEELHVNECFSVPCLNGATCHVHGFAYVCSCALGFTGMVCEKEIDECETERCENGGTCVDAIGSFSCQCPSGFTGNTCEVNEDDCVQIVCLNGGTCLDRIASFDCKCSNGFKGSNCEVDINECASNPCENNATCVDGVDNFSCQCWPGFVGKLCDVNEDECASSPCVNGGICVDGIANFSCECPRGFSGAACEVNVDDCEGEPCFNGATCVDLNTDFKCACPPTFSGKFCETELSSDFQLNFASGILDYAQVTGFPRTLSEFSTCLWVETSDKSNYGTPLSYANLTVDNIITLTDYSGFVLYVNGEAAVTDVMVNDGHWHFVCVTWNSNGGHWKIFLDGQAADQGHGLADNTIIPADGILVIGQEQDGPAAGFSAAESFVGSIAHLNLWDRALLPDEIRTMSGSCGMYHGNLKAWPDFLGGLKGRIKVEESRFCKGCLALGDTENGNVEIGGLGVDAVAVYKCEAGFQMSGEAKRRCGVHGEWSGSVPQCNRVDCGFPGYLANGLIHGVQYTFNGTVEYSCNSGFALVGQHNRTCLDTGLWSGDSPICQELLCPQPKTPEHGQIVSVVDHFRPHDELKFKCDPGYRLDGPSVVTCLPDAQWDEEIPVCQPIACSHPPKVDNGRVESARTILRAGDLVKVVCDIGYTLAGQESGALLTCGKDLTWQGDVPRCLAVDCSKPPSSPNSNAEFNETTYGSQVHYRCKTGFTFNSSRNNTVKFLKCDQAGQWSGDNATCHPMSCGPPSLIKHGEVATQGNTFGSSARYSCQPGYSLSGSAARVCQDNGSWSGEAPHCSRIRCPDSSPGPNMMIEGPDRPWTPGVTLKYSCAAGYSRNGSSHRTCLDSGVWSHREPSCIRIQCPSPPDVTSGYVIPGSSRFFTGSRIEYSCQVGFRIDGEGRLECGPTGEWIGVKPTCPGVTCGPVDNLDHGSFIVESFVYQSRLTYKCNTGFRLVNGSVVRTCGPDGNWTGTDPKCVPVKCKNPGAPANGLVRVKGVGQGDNATVECGPGYIMNGSPEMFCGMDGEWTNRNVSCVPVMCPLPDSPANGKVSAESGFGFEAVAVYSCDIGYRVMGAENTRTCRRDGSWSGITPECQLVECPQPFEQGFLHGRRHVRNFAVGAMMLFECNVGFRLSGERILTCLNDSTWDNPEPSCVPVSCPQPPPPAGKGFVISGGSHFGDSATYACEEGHVLLGGSSTRLCLEDGSWSGFPPSCEPVPCPEPPGPDNGSVKISGGSAEFGCEDGFRMVPEEPARSTCSINGTWQPEFLSVCQEITCPEPAAISNGSVNYELGIGSTARYFCDEGLVLEGSPTVTCAASGLWDSPTPECLPVPCPAVSPSALRNGTISGEIFDPVYQSVIVFSCNDGFRLIGDSSLSCGSNGSWDGPWPLCTRHKCSRPEKPANGIIFVPDTAADSLIVHYACEPGFVLQGDSNLTCSTGDEWSGPTPTCERVLCHPPPKVLNSLYIGPEATYGFGDNVTYECLAGFTLEDGSTVFCGSDGDWWPSDFPTCVPSFCNLPNVSSNHVVRVTPVGSLPEPSGNATFAYGTLMSVGCSTGYSMEIDNFVIWCGSGGTWNGSDEGIPDCTRVSCETPVPPVNGTVTSKEPSHYGDTATFSCNEGFVLDAGSSILRCELDGSWNGSRIECHPVECPTPGNVSHGFVSGGGDPGFGAMITYNCEPGFRLQGPGTRICGADEAWTGLEPFCYPVECPDLNSATNSEIEIDTPLVGGTVTYRCSPGFWLSGDPVRTCLLNGTWSGASPDCVVIECPVPPGIVNGNVTVHGLTWGVGSTVDYSCDFGFKLAGSGTRTCLQKGSWGGEEPQCVRVLCEDPPHLTNGWVHWDGVFVGATARYYCHVGYRASGVSTEIVCDDTGSWTAGGVSCQKVTCSMPESTGVNSIRIKVESADQEHNRMAPFNTTLVFDCPPLYGLDGPKRLVCGVDGNWDNSTPTCVRKFCDRPPPVNNSRGVPGKRIEVGNSVKYNCRKGFSIPGTINGTVTCGSDGRWTGVVPRCVPAFCGTPPQVPGAGVRRDTPEGQGEFTYESTVTYTCEDGLELEGDHALICDAGGTWVGKVPRCSSTICRPPPETEHSTVQVESYDDRSTAHYRCEEGFRMSGVAQLTCRSAGVWEGGRCQSCCTVLLLVSGA